MQVSFDIRGMCRRASRISLRGLLLLVLLLCLLLGLEARRLNRQRTAMAWVRSHGGVALYGWQLDNAGQWTEKHPPYPRWVMKVIGPDFLQTIKAVDIYNSDVADLTPLLALPDLEELHLNGNQITTLAPISNLEQLRVLHLAYNAIDDIEPLGQLSNLEKLIIDGNQVRSLEPLRGCISLTELIATDNQICDLAPLVALGASTAAGDLPRLNYVDLRQNPVTTAQVRQLKRTLFFRATVLTDVNDR